MFLKLVLLHASTQSHSLSISSEDVFAYSGQVGSWSTNNAVAQIDSESGVAVAMQVGVVQIGYDVAGHHTVNEV